MLKRKVPSSPVYTIHTCVHTDIRYMYTHVVQTYGTHTTYVHINTSQTYGYSCSHSRPHGHTQIHVYTDTTPSVLLEVSGGERGGFRSGVAPDVGRRGLCTGTTVDGRSSVSGFPVVKDDSPKDFLRLGSGYRSSGPDARRVVEVEGALRDVPYSSREHVCRVPGLGQKGNPGRVT